MKKSWLIPFIPFLAAISFVYAYESRREAYSYKNYAYTGVIKTRWGTVTHVVDRNLPDTWQRIYFTDLKEDGYVLPAKGSSKKPPKLDPDGFDGFMVKNLDGAKNIRNLTPIEISEAVGAFMKSPSIKETASEFQREALKSKGKYTRIN